MSFGSWAYAFSTSGGLTGVFAIGAAGVAYAGVLKTLGYNRARDRSTEERDDDQRWLNVRREVYAEFLSAGYEIQHLLDQMRNLRREMAVREAAVEEHERAQVCLDVAKADLRRRYTVLCTLATVPVMDSAGDLMVAMAAGLDMDDILRKMSLLIAAIRRDLGVRGEGGEERREPATRR